MTSVLERDSYVPSTIVPDDLPVQPKDVGQDDEAHLTVEDALDIVTLLKESAPPPPPSVTYGWEERAKDVHTGRIYKMQSTGPRTHLGAAGALGADVQIETASRMPVDPKRAHKFGGMVLGYRRQGMPAIY